MLEEYLKKQEMKVDKRYGDNGKKYIVRLKQPARKVSDIIAIAKDIQIHLTEFDYVIIKVAKSGSLLVELIVTSDEIRWRITRGLGYIDITSSKDVDDLMKILDKLKRVVG